VNKWWINITRLTSHRLLFWLCRKPLS